MRYLLGFFTILMLSTCATENESVTRISGKVSNYEDDFFVLKNFNVEDTISMTADSFQLDLEINEPTYYTLHFGNKSVQLYIEPNENLSIALDPSVLDSTKFYGDLGVYNKTILENTILSFSLKLWEIDSVNFLNRLDSIIMVQTANLNELSMKGHVLFDQVEHARIDKFEYELKTNYPMFYRRLFKKDPDIDSASFFRSLEGYSFADGYLYNIPYYAYSALNYISDQVQKVHGKQAGIKHLNSEADFIKNNVQDTVAKTMLLFRLTEIALNNYKPDSVQYIYDNFLSASNDNRYKERLTKKFQIFKETKAGMKAKPFAYKNIHDEEIDLEELRGNLVYIDIWATWCKPCVAEIPALEQLQEQFKDENVKFVSISIDKRRSKWQKFVTDQQMRGIQLWCGGNWGGDIIKKYAISSIPRFILIDENGNLIDSDAPRPSNKETIQLIERSLPRSKEI
ncbi:MAG: TlpA family protein disulfide reductase [Flavobacteriales bacterium]|nr:TlpA family protein disulfide reductase [Flavobacteriales bacterium]